MFTDIIMNIQPQKENEICRLCLGTKSDSFEALMGIKRYMLEFVVADVNIDISTDPKTCRNCSKNVQTAYQFKSFCLENNVTTDGIANLELLSKIIDPVPKSELTIKEEVFRKCWFCRSKFTIFDKLNSERDAFLKTMLDKCLPELDSKANITPCKKCLKTLGNFFAFLNYCWETEAKIKNYCKIRTLNSQKQIDLYDVFQFVQHSSMNTHRSSNTTYGPKNRHSEVAVNTPSTLILEQDTKYMDGKRADVKMQIKQELSDVFDNTGAVESFNYTNVKSEFKFASDDGNNEFMTDSKVENFAIKTEEIDLGKHEVIESKDEIETEAPTMECSYTNDIQFPIQNAETQTSNCNLCPYNATDEHFSVKTNAIQFPTQHAETQTYNCNLCPYNATDGLSLAKHKKDAHQSTYKCQTCPYSTGTLRYLKRHMDRHKDLSTMPTLKCAQCSYETKRRRNLHKHITNMHRNPRDLVTHICGWCQYETVYKSVLHTHIMRHHEC